MPSLSSSPRIRSAPQRGLSAAISRMSAARPWAVAQRSRTSSPERTKSCPMPPEKGRGFHEQERRSPRGDHVCGENHGQTLPGGPSDTAHDLPLRHNELLSEQGIPGHELGPRAKQIDGQSQHEPQDLQHVSLRIGRSPRGDQFVATTRGSSGTWSLFRRSAACTIGMSDGGRDLRPRARRGLDSFSPAQVSALTVDADRRIVASLGPRFGFGEASRHAPSSRATPT